MDLTHIENINLICHLVVSAPASNKSKQTTTIGICHQKFHNCNNTSLQIPTTNKVLKEEATCHPGSWRAFEKMCENTTVLITKTI